MSTVVPRSNQLGRTHEPQANPLAQLGSQRAAEEGEASLNGVALVVEDDPALLSALCRWLEAEGWTATGASDGCQGFDSLMNASAPPDIVITDVIMPCSDGFSLARRVRRRWPHLPFVFLTGELGVELPAWLATVPEIRLLRKPLRPPELRWAMRAVLERAASPERTS